VIGAGFERATGKAKEAAADRAVEREHQIDSDPRPKDLPAPLWQAERDADSEDDWNRRRGAQRVKSTGHRRQTGLALDKGYIETPLIPAKAGIHAAFSWGRADLGTLLCQVQIA
jgi:hypothetical protein